MVLMIEIIIMITEVLITKIIVMVVMMTSRMNSMGRRKT